MAKKYSENLTGTSKSYNPNTKIKTLKIKNTNHGNRINLYSFLSLCFINNSFSDDKNFVILDKKIISYKYRFLDKKTSKKQTVKINLKEKI